MGHVAQELFRPSHCGSLPRKLHQDEEAQDEAAVRFCRLRGIVPRVGGRLGEGPASAAGLRIEDTQPPSRRHPAGRRRVVETPAIPPRGVFVSAALPAIVPPLFPSTPHSQSASPCRTRSRKSCWPIRAGSIPPIILRWLQDTYQCEVVTFTADLGQGEELEPARKGRDAGHQGNLYRGSARGVRARLRLPDVPGQRAV